MILTDLIGLGVSDSNHHSFIPYLVDWVNRQLKDVVQHPSDDWNFRKLIYTGAQSN